MADLKTQKTNKSAKAFLKKIENESRREDCLELLGLMEEVTGQKAAMWGTSIVGFGSYHYRYASGREGDWFVAGFAPRKQDLTIYVMSGFDNLGSLLKKLGKHKTGKCCLYVKRLEDVDRKVLKQLITRSVKEMSARNR